MWDIVKIFLPQIMDIVKTVVPDPGKQLEIQQAMTEKLLAQEAAVMDSMKAVMTADSTSQNRFVSTARPAVVYWSMAMVTFIMCAGIFGMGEATISALQQVPEGLWTLITVGVGAFSVTRGLEKSVKEWKR